MKKWKLRIPAISFLWQFTDAETEEEAFDNIVSELERADSKIAWRDRAVWEIREVEDPTKKEQE